MKAPRANLAVYCLCLLAGACGDDAGSAGPRTIGQDRVGGRVVSTVDGVGITLEEVERVARAEGVPPRQALRRLQDDLLLAAEAERRGFGRDRETAGRLRAAGVQKLLEEEVERSVPESSIDDAAIARAYEQHRERYVQPEKRGSWHALARLDAGATPEADAAARAEIAAVLARLRAAADPAAELRAMQADSPRELTIEEVPPLARDADAERAYLDALFARAEPGVHPEPVRSGYGWHAIVLTEIVPARNVSLADARAELHRSLLVFRRRVRLEQLLARLAERTPPAPDQARVRAVLERDVP